LRKDSYLTIVEGGEKITREGSERLSKRLRGIGLDPWATFFKSSLRREGETTSSGKRSGTFERTRTPGGESVKVRKRKRTLKRVRHLRKGKSFSRATGGKGREIRPYSRQEGKKGNKSLPCRLRQKQRGAWIEEDVRVSRNREERVNSPRGTLEEYPEDHHFRGGRGKIWVYSSWRKEVYAPFPESDPEESDAL